MDKIKLPKPDKKLVLSLLHLHLLSTEAEDIHEALKSYFMSNHRELDEKAFSTIWLAAMSIIHIKFLSFKTELHEKKALIPDKTFQSEVRKIFRSINTKWPDLEDYRNEVLVHEFRKKGESIFASEKPGIRKYVVPTKLSDFKELVNAMGIIRLDLKEKYPELFKMFESRKHFLNNIEVQEKEKLNSISK